MIMNEKHKFCIRCGRKLKNEESQELGFGPVCYQKWQTESISKKLVDINNLKEKENAT